MILERSSVQHRATKGGQRKGKIMANHGLCVPHEKRVTCGVCKHPTMRDTREQVKESPLPGQRNAATSNG